MGGAAPSGEAIRIDARASAGKGVEQQGGLSRSGPVAVESPDRGREPHQLPARPGPVAGPGAVPPFEDGARGRPVHGGAAGRPGRTGPGHVDLVDDLDGVRGVSGQHVGQPRRQPAAGGQRHTGLPGGLVEVEEAADGVGVVGASGGGDPRLQSPFEDRPFGRAADGGGDDVDPGGEGTVRRPVHSLRPGTHGLGGLGGRGGGPVGDQDPFDDVGLRQLAGRPPPDGAGAHQEDGRHRKSGSWSWRQPPLVGGAPPRPRRRSSQPTAPANPRATRERRRALMRGASWNRTSDLILIRDAL